VLGDIYFNFYFDLDKAIYYYDQIHIKFPKSIKLNESLIKLGDCYLIKGNLIRAQESYAKNKNKNDFSITTFKLAELDYYKGNISEALEKYNLILEKKGSTDSLANNVLERTIFINLHKSENDDLKAFAFGELLAYQQKYSESVGHLKKLFAKNSNISSSAGRIMANILIKLEKYTEANEVLSDLMDQYPEDNHIDEIIFQSAKIEEILGNYQKSFDLYQILLNDHDSSLYYEKARENARLLNEKIKRETVSG
jgi:tetratricopeptide (TPR) repeat protein